MVERKEPRNWWQREEEDWQSIDSMPTGEPFLVLASEDKHKTWLVQNATEATDSSDGDTAAYWSYP